MRIAMILAAGRGERMGVLTQGLPKPLVAVAGTSLIERHVRAFAAAGFERLVVNLGYRGAQIREALGDGRQFGIPISYSEEGEAPLETGGGIQRALPLLDSVFALVNADVLTDYPRAALATRMTTLPADTLAHFVLVPNPPFHAEGDFSLEAGRVGTADQPRYTFSGISVQRAELYAACQPGRFPAAPIWQAAARRGQVTGEVFNGRWSDVGTPERLAALEEALSAELSIPSRSGA